MVLLQNHQPKPPRTSQVVPKKNIGGQRQGRAPVHMGIRHRSCLLPTKMVEDHHCFPLHELLVGQDITVLNPVVFPMIPMIIQWDHGKIDGNPHASVENVRKIISFRM